MPTGVYGTFPIIYREIKCKCFAYGRTGGSSWSGGLLAIRWLHFWAVQCEGELCGQRLLVLGVLHYLFTRLGLQCLNSASLPACGV
jgi:hypothetical protein